MSESGMGLKGDPRVKAEWELKVGQMSLAQCWGHIKRMREKSDVWNVNTRVVYGLLKNRIAYLNSVKGVVLTNEYEIQKRKDEVMAEQKILEECCGGVGAAVQPATKVSWVDDLERRKAWGRARKAEREARRHW